MQTGVSRYILIIIHLFLRSGDEKTFVFPFGLEFRSTERLNVPTGSVSDAALSEPLKVHSGSGSEAVLPEPLFVHPGSVSEAVLSKPLFVHTGSVSGAALSEPEELNFAPSDAKSSPDAVCS